MRSTAERPYDTNAASSGRRDAASRVAACDVIDLRSDFLAHGTAEMSEAWARAAREPYHFGLREDPYQAALERRVAEMTAHEDALVFPTCTMANLVGIMLGAAPGTRVLTHENAHVITSEAGGAAAFAGVQLVPLVGDPRNAAAEQWRAAAADGCHARFHNAAGSSLHAPDCTRRTPMTASGTAAATITSARCIHAPGASTRNSGIENSERSKSACNRIVGSNPKRRKINAHSVAGNSSSTSREYAGRPG